MHQSAKVTFCALSVAVMHIAWYSEEKPFAVGYADGKLLIGSKEPLEKGAIVVIDAHKVNYSFKNKESVVLIEICGFVAKFFQVLNLSLHVVLTGVNHQYEVESDRSDLADLRQRGDSEAVGQSGLSL